MAFLQSKVRTCLWFEKNGLEAARFWCSLLPDSAVEGEVGPLIVEFTLAGAPMMILNGGPHYKLNPAASIAVLTEDQAETDRLWEALLDGGQAMQCGWLTDRWGVSWQIAPKQLPQMTTGPDREAAARVRQALMKMVKIDLPTLEAAFRGD